MSEDRQQLIAQNLERINESIRKAADRSERLADEINLVVVTKTWSIEIISLAASLGIREFGENRIQDAIPKIGPLNREFADLNWHMIGHLQSNKARLAIEHFNWVQSVDSLKIAHKLSKYSVEINKPVDILLEVNISGEASKYGINPDEANIFSREMRSLPGLKLRGLMTIGPMTTDLMKIRKSFQRLKEIYDNIRSENPDNDIDTLSMGMSDDYEIAIEEGATMIRLGRAVFGPRKY